MRDQWRVRNDANHLMLTFEELTKQKKATCKKLVDFLQLPPLTDKELDEDVLPKLEIEWMSKHQYDILGKVHFEISLVSYMLLNIFFSGHFCNVEIRRR